MNQDNTFQYQASATVLLTSALMLNGCKPDTSAKTSPAGEELVPYVEIKDDVKPS